MPMTPPPPPPPPPLPPPPATYRQYSRRTSRPPPSVSRFPQILRSSTTQISAPTPTPLSNRPIPSLPLELWSQIFTNLPHPSTLSALSETSYAFHLELLAPSSQSLWQAVWDATSRPPSVYLLSHPWFLVPGDWRAQVAASRFLVLLPKPEAASRFFYVPPRFARGGQVLNQDRVRTRPSAVDIEDVLGRARVAVAMGGGVVVGFERGIGYVRRGIAGRLAEVFYDDAHMLKGVSMLEVCEEEGFVVGICESRVLIKVEVKGGVAVRWPLRWRMLDEFGIEGGNIVSLNLSEGARWAFIGFDTGRVRVVNLKGGGCRRVLALAESADLVCGNRKWVLAVNCFQPICACVWDVADWRPVRDFTQTSVGWEEVTTIAGICITEKEDVFALWDGRNAVRLLNVKTGYILRVVHVHGSFDRGVLRNAVDEAEEGAAAPHLGRGKMIPFKDRKNVAVATSNRVFAVSLQPSWQQTLETVQMDGAKRALLALSTDDRVLVTAEGDVFGGLGYKVVGRQSIAVRPKVSFWDVQTGKKYGAVEVAAAVTSLSVCGDTLAAVCGAVGQVVIAFATPSEWGMNNGSIR